MDFCFSSGGLDLCGAISRICFLWLPIYCFGFPDNLFSNRICIPATISNFWHNTGGWWRRLLAAEPGSLLEINGHWLRVLSDCATALFVLKGFNPAGWHPGIDRRSTAQILNFTKSRKLNKTTFYCESFRYGWDEDCCFTGSPFFECGSSGWGSAKEAGSGHLSNL